MRNNKNSCDELVDHLLNLSKRDNYKIDNVKNLISGLIYSYTNSCLISAKVPDIIKDHHLEIYGPDNINKKYRCRLINNNGFQVNFYGEGNTIAEAVTNATLISASQSYF